MPVTYFETVDSGDYAVDNKGKWSGWRKYSTPVADVATNRALIAAVSWTVNGIAMLPKSVRAVKNHECPGNWFLIATYEFPADPSNFDVGRGYLSVAVDTVSVRATLDAAGDGYIEGDQEANLDVGLHWKVTQGSNIVHVRRVIVRVTTAFARAAFNWTTHVSNYYDDTGRPKKNSDACANILGAPAGELLMLGVEIPRAFVLDANNTKIPVIYTMLFQPKGVENDMMGQTLKVAHFHRVLHQKYILHVSDTGSGTRYWLAENGNALPGTAAGPTLPPNSAPQMRIVTIDKKLAGTQTTRTLYAETAYSAINSLIYWGA